MPRAPPVTIAVLPSSLPMAPLPRLARAMISDQILAAKSAKQNAGTTHARRRLQAIAAHRPGPGADRPRDRKAGAAGARPAGAGEGGLGQSGRLQGSQARRP